MFGSRFWKSIVKPGDTVVDATCGNGYDTLAMAKLALCDVHSLGKVIAIDKQSEALISTSTLLQSDLSLQQVFFPLVFTFFTYLC